MLRKIRITAAAVFFTVITLLLLDFTGTLHAWFGWMAKVQLLPAVLAVNAGVVAALVLLTLLFGRVYCSVICPLGVFQDVVSRAAARWRKNRFRYSRALSWLRYGILALFLVALVAHFKPVSNLLAPYSAYGRIVSNLFAPLYLWGNNLLAYFAERIDSYAFYRTNVWVRSAATFAVAAATFALIAVLAACLLQGFLSLYLTVFVLGVITTITEWENIYCSATKKVFYAITFPVFMFTYIPIVIVSLFHNPAWQPIHHSRSVDLQQICAGK